MYQAVEKIPYLLETLESHTGPNKTLLMELFTNPAKVCYYIQTLLWSHGKLNLQL